MSVVAITYREPRLQQGYPLSMNSSKAFFNDVTRAVIVDGALRIDYQHDGLKHVRVIAAGSWIDYNLREEN